MLAKYIPGGVWTPTARVVALRRFGVSDTPVVLASILLEAGLSAVAGVVVFVVGLVIIGGADVPLLPVAAFAVVVAFLLYPPVFGSVASRLLRPFGADSVAPLPARTAFELLGFYALTWPLGGAGLFFMLRSVGGDPPVSSIPYLGGVSRRRRDRRRARGLRPLGARRPRSFDVRAAARGRHRIGRARRHDPEPARDHARRGACSCSSAALLLRRSGKPTVVGREVEAAPVAALPRDEVLRG